MNEFKIYYEDTDASGRVYHANYLRFLERGRTNLIYQTEYTHKILLDKFDIIFVVKENENSSKKAFEFPCPKHKKRTSTFKLTSLVKTKSVSPTKS